MSFWPWKKKQAEPKPAAKPKPKPKPKADVPAQPASAAGGGMGMGGMDMFAGLAVKTPDKKATMSAPSGPPGGAPHTDATPSKRDVSSAQDPVLDQPTVAAAPASMSLFSGLQLGGSSAATNQDTSAAPPDTQDTGGSLLATLNAGMPDDATPAGPDDAPSSGFSFMNASDEPPADTPSDPSTTPVTTPSRVVEHTPVSPTPASGDAVGSGDDATPPDTTAATDSTPKADVNAFDFLIPSQEDAQLSLDDIAASAAAPPPTEDPTLNAFLSPRTDVDENADTSLTEPSNAVDGDERPQDDADADEDGSPADEPAGGGFSLFSGLAVKQTGPSGSTSAGSALDTDLQSTTSDADEVTSVGTGTSSLAFEQRRQARRMSRTSQHRNTKSPVELDDADTRSQVSLRANASVSDKLQHTKSDLESRLVRYWESMLQIHTEQSELRQRELKAQTGLKEADDKLKRLEEEQRKAAEEEEYEKADKLNDSIESLKRKTKGMHIAARQTSTKMIGLKSRKQRNTKNILERIQRGLQLFEQYKNVEEKELSVFVQTSTATLQEQEDRIKADCDRIDRSLSHIATDLDHIQEEEETIEESIRTSTADVEAEKASLLEEEKTIESEIEELVQQLRQKEEDLRQCRKSLDVAEAKIAKARTKHKRGLHVVQQKKERILQEQREALQEKSSLDAERLQLQKKTEEVERQKQSFREVISTIDLQQKRADELIKRLEQAEELESKWGTGAEDTSLPALKDKMAKSDAQIDVLSQQLLELEEKVSAQRQIILQADTTRPGLVEEKKLAVKARNYKKAGAVSKKIKELENAKQTASESIEELRLQLNECNKELAEEQERKDELKASLDKIVMDVDLQRLTQVIERSYWVEHLLGICEGNLKSSRHASDASAVAAFEAEQKSLQVLADASQREAQELRNKHSWADNYPLVVNPYANAAAVDVGDDMPPASTVGMDDVKSTPATDAAPAGRSAEDIKAELEEAKSKTTTLETELEQAIAEEDYEAADRLDGELENAKKRVAALEAELAACPQPQADSANEPEKGDEEEEEQEEEDAQEDDEEAEEEEEEDKEEAEDEQQDDESKDNDDDAADEDNDDDGDEEADAATEDSAATGDTGAVEDADAKASSDSAANNDNADDSSSAPSAAAGDDAKDSTPSADADVADKGTSDSPSKAEEPASTGNSKRKRTKKKKKKKR